MPPTSDHPASLFYKYPKPLAVGEVDLRFSLPTSHLAAFGLNLFSAANLGISEFALLRVGQDF